MGSFPWLQVWRRPLGLSVKEWVWPRLDKGGYGGDTDLSGIGLPPHDESARATVGVIDNTGSYPTGLVYSHRGKHSDTEDDLVS